MNDRDRPRSRLISSKQFRSIRHFAADVAKKFPRRIGEAARRELEGLLERRVHLFLFVKVRDDWGDDPERYRDLGLDFDA